ELKLVVTEAGDGDANDHADWADAKFIADVDETGTEITSFLNGEALDGETSISDAKPLEFTWEAEGDESEIDEISATFDGKAYEEEASLDLAGKPGDYELVVHATDKDGNKTEETYTIHVTTSAEAMRTLVERFDDNGAFSEDGTAHAFDLQLLTIDRCAEKEIDKKVVKHVKGFQTLLDKKQDAVSEDAYKALKADVDYLLEKWQ